MDKFTRLTATACPLNFTNLNTDQLLPARYLKWPRSAGIGKVLLQDLRFDADGRVLYHFVLIDFVCKSNGGTLCCGTDASDATWAPVIELSQYGLADSTISVIQKALDRVREGPWTPREVHWNNE